MKDALLSILKNNLRVNVSDGRLEVFTEYGVKATFAISKEEADSLIADGIQKF